MACSYNWSADLGGVASSLDLGKSSGLENERSFGSDRAASAALIASTTITFTCLSLCPR